MINKTLLIAILLIINNITAQNTDIELNNISLSVVLPDNSEYLQSKSLSKIETKIQHIVSKHGISGKGYTNEFLIYPKFEIYDESIVEGMRNIVVVEVEISFFIQQYSTKKIFSTFSKSLKGSGFTKEKAIVNAISKISTTDSRLKEFIDTGKQKILAYYENNCQQIINDSDSFIKMKKYQEAIAILSSIPKEAKNCYNSIQQKSIEAYNEYQKQLCSQNIIKAKSEIANNNFSSALHILGYIDPSSICSREAEMLINKTALKVDQKEQKEWNLMKQRYNDKMNMEKYRLNITKEIAKAYYNSKPTTVIYKSLF
ncbi:MAG: hypothetical protein COA67_04700 [Lutibacter sp.]|nr:MAG: hypothetical protein COA67_04700 [Lutibacter sp.]